MLLGSLLTRVLCTNKDYALTSLCLFMFMYDMRHGMPLEARGQFLEFVLSLGLNSGPQAWRQVLPSCPLSLFCFCNYKNKTLVMIKNSIQSAVTVYFISISCQVWRHRLSFQYSGGWGRGWCECKANLCYAVNALWS